MKRIMRKNQVIITVLAVMIAIAGYLTYAGRVEVADSRDISMENTSDAKEAIAEYDTIDTAKEDATDAALTDIESLDQDIDDPGKMVLANGLTVSDYMAQTKLAREQTRGKNKEDLLARQDLSRGLSAKVTNCSTKYVNKSFRAVLVFENCSKFSFAHLSSKRTENLARSFRSSESLHSQSIFVSRY